MLRRLSKHLHQCCSHRERCVFYNGSDVIMGTMASQITSLPIAYSTAYSGADQRKHQSSALLAFVRGIHRWSVDSSHKGPVTWKKFPFDDAIIILYNSDLSTLCLEVIRAASVHLVVRHLIRSRKVSEPRDLVLTWYCGAEVSRIHSIAVKFQSDFINLDPFLVALRLRKFWAGCVLWFSE